jgi:hypothetical protein
MAVGGPRHKRAEGRPRHGVVAPSCARHVKSTLRLRQKGSVTGDRAEGSEAGCVLMSSDLPAVPPVLTAATAGLLATKDRAHRRTCRP